MSDKEHYLALSEAYRRLAAGESLDGLECRIEGEWSPIYWREVLLNPIAKFRIKPATVKHPGGEYPAPVGPNYKGTVYVPFINGVFELDSTDRDAQNSIALGLAFDDVDKAIACGCIIYNADWHRSTP